MEEVQLLPHQYKVLKSLKREVFLGGGVGAGKTMIGSLWSILKARKTPPDVYGLIVSNTYPQLYDTTIRAFYQFAHKAGVRLNPPQIPRGRGPADILVLGEQGTVRILLRSLEHYERLSGLEVGWIWADEVWQTKKEAIDLLNARLRDRFMNPLQVLMTTTLDDPSTWMYERFVENHDPRLQDIIYAPTELNPHLPDGYLETLKRTYSESMFRRMVCSEWVALDQDRIYTSFKREENVSSEIILDENLPLIWAHDFNIGFGKPMSSAILQYVPRVDRFHVLAEIVLDGADTNDAVAEFQSIFGHLKNPIIICGDASGYSKDTRSRMNDYEIMRRAGFNRFRVPRANPPVRDRHNLVNSYCKNATGDVRILVHPKCRTLIKGMETVHLKKGAHYIEDDSQREQHITTALGYAVWELSEKSRNQIKQIRASGI